MSGTKKFNKNVLAYIIAAVLLAIIVIVFIVCGPFSKKEEKFHMTKEEFVTLANSGDDDGLLESAFDWTENYCPIDTKNFSKATQPVKNVQAVLHLHYEVLNGGFPQFYFNGYHTHGFDYESAFKAVNLNEIAELYLKAQECFETIKHTMPTGSSTEEISKWYDNNPLDEYDKQYAESEEDIVTAVAEYIRDNIDCFGD